MLRVFDQIHHTSLRLAYNVSIEFERKTVSAATWRRPSGDITVVKVEPARGLWMGRNAAFTHLCANSNELRQLAQLTSLALNRDYMIWVRSCQDPPPSMGTGSIRVSGLLIANHHSNMSLKAWRGIREKLIFEPRRLRVPKFTSLAELHEGQHWLLQGEGSVAKDDGGTILLSYTGESLTNLGGIFTFLAEDPGELIYYRLDYLCHRDDRAKVDLLIQYSSFGERYRYWWESDAQMWDRMMNGSKK